MDSVLERHINRKKFCGGYIFLGDKEKSLSAMEDLSKRIFCENFSACGKCYFCGIKDLRKNPDFYYINPLKFGIEESLALSKAAFKTAYRGGKKVFLIQFNSPSAEAQNALLKIFEEPPRSAYFLIYASSFENILDTLRSRLVSVCFREGNDFELKKRERDFLDKPFHEKLNYFSAIKDRQDAKSFVMSLVSESARSGKFTEAECFLEGLRLIDDNLPLGLIGLRMFFK